MQPEPYDDDDFLPVPRVALQFPLVMPRPPGFRPAEPSTWPAVPGRLEYVNGRLLFMPPCGEEQQSVAMSLAGLLDEWTEAHPEFRGGANEAGMKLGNEVRGADGAVWRRAGGPTSKRFPRVPPILAVEIAGRDEDEATLTEKAHWYFDHGVKHVWLVLPDTYEVVVMAPGSRKRRFKSGDKLPPNADLPGLVPSVDRFFRQLR